MPDRRRQIELLIATRFDHLWFPAGALRTSCGLAPSSRVPCPACVSSERPGWVAVKRGGVVVKWSPCVACGGVEASETTKQKRGRGFIAVDPMDTERRAVGSTDTHATSRPRKRVKCDACQDHDGKPTGVVKGERCTVCDGEGMRDLHRFDLRLDVRDVTGADPIDVAIDRRDELADWHALELAQARVIHVANKPLRFLALTVNAVQALRLLDDVNLRDERDPDSQRDYLALTMFERALYDLALDYIDTQMPDPIRVPAGAAANLRDRANRRTKAKGKGQALKVRDAEIRKLARTHGPQWIAAEYGISVSSVYVIVNGRSEVA